jgi:hypothetical protein
MFIRTILVSALFLALSCVSLQASTDTSLNVPSNTTDETVLLFAGVKDRRKGNQDADECDAADACQFFFDCPSCGALLSPKMGDCCIYCSYGDVKCPPIQQGNSCCS